MKKILTILILGIFLISFTSASYLGSFEKNSCVELYQSCSSCTFVNITSVKIPGISTSNPMKIVPINEEMNKSIFDFTYEYCNTSRFGNYRYNVCGDKGGSLICENHFFTISSDGNELSIESSLVMIFLIIFFISLILGYYNLNKNINYERWYKNIQEKYRRRNFVKMVLSSMGYNFIKHQVTLYYLIGFPIIVLLDGIAKNYNIIYLTGLLENLLFIYSLGVIMVALLLLGQVQEFITKLIDDTLNESWGLINKQK